MTNKQAALLAAVLWELARAILKNNIYGDDVLKTAQVFWDWLGHAN